MKRRVLVTGASGFVGWHLIRYLTQQDVDIWGTTKTPVTNEGKSVQWLELDLLDKKQVRQIISQIKPDLIFHLAGQSSVKTSWDEKAMTIETNVIATIHLLEAVREICPDSFVLTVGSAEEYGPATADQIPITEAEPTSPVSPYGISKLTAGLFAMQFAHTYCLNIIHVRPFNHIGPGQAPGFVAADFARQIVSIELGIRENPIKVGNLNIERDFTDVRDIVRAYWMLSSKGKSGEIYNVCSGKGLKIKNLLQGLCQKSTKKIQIVEDPALFRTADVPSYIGDNSKICRETTWEPVLPISETLEDIINDWRTRLIPSLDI